MEEEVWHVKELGAFLGLSRTSIYEMMKAHRIPFNRLGRRIIFYKPVITEWLKTTTIRSAKDEMRLGQQGLHVISK